jgi:hypothetical protein
VLEGGWRHDDIDDDAALEGGIGNCGPHTDPASAPWGPWGGEIQKLI